MRHEVLQPHRALIAESIPAHWQQPLLRLAVAAAILFALFAGEWAAMVSQWWDSSTYNHILLVPPVIAWLIWQRANELAHLVPQAWWPGLFPLAATIFIWLLGDISGLGTASQLGAVAMAPAVTLIMLGPRVAWAMLFPLTYFVFLVPVGDELVPALQAITASITIVLTEFSGIPAYIEGVFIDTPAGLFEVAEACSGVKFLVAMVALGALVAHVCFRSWKRRLAFMAAAIVLPIIANGIRAWGTIYIAQFRGVQSAQGFDHIFYGWFFFALVIALLLAASWRFFDRDPNDPFLRAELFAAMPVFDRLERRSLPGWTAIAAIAGLCLLGIAWGQLARSVEADLPHQIAAPQVPGWQVVSPDQQYEWEPLAGGADQKLLVTYQDSYGRRVDIAYALYAAQEEGREAGAFGEGALVPDSEWRWLGDEASIAGARSERLQALGSIQRVAATWYRHGDMTTGSRLRLKLATMRDRLLLQAEPTAMLIISAEERAGQSAVQSVADFAAAAQGIAQWMDRAGKTD